MKESFWGYWIIALGVFVIIIMMLVSNVTTTNTQDYYLVKDVTEAAMVDAIDYSYYRHYKELKINREKFIENFLRRFSESVSLNTYTIDFYDIYEAPPKVSVKITTESGNFIVNGDSASFDIVNKVDAVLELSGTASSEASTSSSYEKNNYQTPGFDPSQKDNTDSETPNVPYEPYDPSKKKVPTGSQIGIVVAQSWYQQKYIDCPLGFSGGYCRGTSTVKSQYRNNPTQYINEIMADWERAWNIKFTSQEAEQFRQVAKQYLTPGW